MPTRWILLSALLAACTGPDDTDDPPAGNTFCDGLGLPAATFQGGLDNEGSLAGDFTVPTDDGDWVFSERFTGCSSYVFFVHVPGISDRLFETDLDPLITDGTDTVEYFFLSDAESASDRAVVLDEVSANLADALRRTVRDKDDRAAWRARFHLSTKRASAIEGSVGAYVTRQLALAADPAARVDLGDRGMAPVPPPEVFGIDRDQRFDAGGNLSPYVGASRDELGMGAYLARFYDYRHALDRRFAEETGVTVVPVLDALTTGRVFVLPAALPEATTMATFDRLELDVTIDCRYDNPFACSEWDRIASVAWCEDGEACTVRREIARWITPYWRRGRQRYALEASPMLGLLRAGGTQHLRIELGPDWERATEWYAALSLRLSDTGGPRAVAAIPAFGGGGFGEAYNDREPVAFTPPAGTTRAELVALVTGHGQVDGNNCAEWCDHRHTFSIDATDLPTIQHTGEAIGSPTGCGLLASQGVIPGQWGNWSQSRAYWCPGMGVTPHRLDLTEHVAEGVASALTYRGSFGTGAPAGGDIALSSYVVFYED